MIIVREVFTAKPGMASKLAKMFKEMAATEGMRGRVMTDLVGEYNTVVMEAEYENLAAFAAEMQKYQDASQKAKPEGQAEKPKGPSHTDMYLTGRREVFRVW